MYQNRLIRNLTKKQKGQIRDRKNGIERREEGGGRRERDSREMSRGASFAVEVAIVFLLNFCFGLVCWTDLNTSL